MKTYISLFSSAGVGCYGFKQNNFECIATNELVSRRLEIQKVNRKCKYKTGYISHSIENQETKDLINAEFQRWQTKHNIDNLDVIVATPPCQGMSLANHKKNDTDAIRNNLVIESINQILFYKPKFFIIENVLRFLKTVCTDNDGVAKTIEEAIKNNLYNDYEIDSRVINFKNYGANSSRTRTLLIGKRRDINEISVSQFFPEERKEKKLKEVIGHLEELEYMGEISDTDIYHNFRVYDTRMLSWIENTLPETSAFENQNPIHRPHRIIKGEIVFNKNKNGDKYKRQSWNKVAPCIHTRNDILASQNTVHPTQNRVFSIRELMLMMNIPNNFKWSNHSLDDLNSLPLEDKIKYIKKTDINIRQCIGEAVPTVIFSSIAKKIGRYLDEKVIANNNLFNLNNLKEYIKANPDSLKYYDLLKIIEFTNTRRESNSAYFTDKHLVDEVIRTLPVFTDDELIILEPSVGIGNFVPGIIEKYKNKRVKLILNDSDEEILNLLKLMLRKIEIPKTFTIEFSNYDYLAHDFGNVDLTIGNPPYKNVSGHFYKDKANNTKSNDLFSYFLEKSLKHSKFVSLVIPKVVLGSNKYKATRELLRNKYDVQSIVDFGEKGFKGVKIETISLLVSSERISNKTKVISLIDNTSLIYNKEYIMDTSFPTWLIYRNEFFDKVRSKLVFNAFKVYRDRQITKKDFINDKNAVRVLKSRNIANLKIVDIRGYDKYIDINNLKGKSVYKYFNDENAILIPNMTYYPRACKLPRDSIVDGSVAILKSELIVTNKQLEYFSTPEFRDFYRLARNKATRTLNIDNTHVFYFGLIKE